MLPPNLPIVSDDHALRQRLRRLREEPIDVVAHITEEIGSRRSGSLGEAHAAAYLNGRLRRAGLKVATHAFEVSPHGGYATLVSALVALLGVVVYYWLPFVALAFLGIALLFAVWERIRPNRPLATRLQWTQLISGSLGVAEMRGRVVICAPLDTQPLLPPWLRWFCFQPQRQMVQLVAGIGLVVVATIGLWDVQRIWWYAQFVLVALLGVVALADQLTIWRPWSLGAGSHAAGLATLLLVAEEIKTLDYLDLWLVGIGACWSGGGVDELVRYCRAAQAPTWFIGVEGVGRGTLAYLTREGTVRPQPADTQLLKLVAAADAADPAINAEPRAYRATTTLAQRLRQRGQASITITALDNEGAVPALGSQADIVATIDEAVIRRTARLVVGLVRQLDATAAES
jgi:hypothetical protein